MVLRASRYRRSRSWSKDRSSHKLHNRRSLLRAICAFSAGALSMVFLWGRLRVHGVGGPRDVARYRDEEGRSEMSTEWLHERRRFLIDQLAIADAKLGTPNRAQDPGFDAGRQAWIPPAGGGAETNTGVGAGHAAGEEAIGGGILDAAGKLIPGLDIGGRQREVGATGLGVDASGHFILGLSTEEFGLTPVDQMMSHYDTRVCDAAFGNGLVDAWRKTGTDCCGDSRGGNGGSDDESSIRSHLIHQEHHHGGGDNLVQMKNVEVDMSVFSDPAVAAQVMKDYKSSKHTDQAYVHPRRGAVKGTCTPEHTCWQHQYFPGWNADWTTKAFQTTQTLQCDEWVDHPVMVMQRDTFANLFHDSEDFVNAFLAMAILRQAPGNVQVFVTDLYPAGPFWTVWDKVFGVGRPTVLSWELGKRFGDKKVCFRDLTIGIFGPAAPTTLARLVSPCFHTALVRAYSDFVIRGLGLQGMTRYASPPTKKVVVTWMARRSSVKWPERAFCSEDGRDSFFTCDYFNHLNIRPLQRRVVNEAEVVQTLKTLKRQEFPNGAEVEVRDMDYNLLSFEEQIKNDLETDVMIGPHGAGLFHIIFTPDRATLIELQIDKTTERKHFNNLAGWSGHSYASRGGPNPLPTGEVKSMVYKAVSEMDLSGH